MTYIYNMYLVKNENLCVPLLEVTCVELDKKERILSKIGLTRPVHLISHMAARIPLRRIVVIPSCSATYMIPHLSKTKI